MSNEYVHFINNSQPAINEDNLNLMQQLIKQDINGAVSGDTLPIGAIVPYTGATAPTNWLTCDGSAISRTTYQDLFNVIGTTFGAGDGSTTFNVPNLKGKVPVGYDNTQTEFNSIGKTGGAKTVTLTKNNLPAGTVVNETGTIHIGTESGTVLSKTTAATAVNNLQPYNTTNYIIKAFQTAGVVAEVVNQHSTSTTDVYSCDYINKLTDYSTTEQKIGTWIDGKPVYRKVVSFGTLPNADTKRVNHGISDLENVINVSGISKRYIPSTQTYNWQPLPLLYAGNSTSFNTSLSINLTVISIACDNDRTDFTENYIFIEYTKTTD